jgi:CheY-like chemotaxis protein
MTTMKREPLKILLVEDDPGDVVLVRDALGERESPLRLDVVGDGVEAMRFVRAEGVHAGVPRPDLILLDLNLPRKSGAEVLAEIKADPALRTIPIIVLTTSKADEDVMRAYREHANAYVSKPSEFARFREIVRCIDEFFAGVVQLPPRPA